MQIYVLETEGDYSGQFEGGRVNLFQSREARREFMAIHDLYEVEEDKDGNCVIYTITI